MGAEPLFLQTPRTEITELFGPSSATYYDLFVAGANGSKVNSIIGINGETYGNQQYIFISDPTDTYRFRIASDYVPNQNPWDFLRDGQSEFDAVFPAGGILLEAGWKIVNKPDGASDFAFMVSGGDF